MINSSDLCLTFYATLPKKYKKYYMHVKTKSFNETILYSRGSFTV